MHARSGPIVPLISTIVLRKFCGQKDRMGCSYRNAHGTSTSCVWNSPSLLTSRCMRHRRRMVCAPHRTLLFQQCCTARSTSPRHQDSTSYCRSSAQVVRGSSHTTSTSATRTLTHRCLHPFNHRRSRNILRMPVSGGHHCAHVLLAVACPSPFGPVPCEVGGTNR